MGVWWFWRRRLFSMTMVRNLRAMRFIWSTPAWMALTGMWSWLRKAPIESVLIPLWTLAGIMVKWASRSSSLRVSISVWYSALWLVMHWWVYAVAECESNELHVIGDFDHWHCNWSGEVGCWEEDVWFKCTLELLVDFYCQRLPISQCWCLLCNGITYTLGVCRWRVWGRAGWDQVRDDPRKGKVSSPSHTPTLEENCHSSCSSYPWCKGQGSKAFLFWKRKRHRKIQVMMRTRRRPLSESTH